MKKFITARKLFAFTMLITTFYGRTVSSTVNNVNDFVKYKIWLGLKRSLMIIFE